MSFEKRIKILKKQLGDKLNETLIHFFLKNGNEVVGIIEDLENYYMIIQTEKGLITIFDMDGYEIEKNQDSELRDVLLSKSKVIEEKDEESVENEKDEFINENSIDLIQKFLREFKIKKHYFELDIKQPDLSFPYKLLELPQNKMELVKRSWDRISSQYRYFLKVQNYSSLRSLANQLIDLGKNLPTQVVFLFNAGCFLYEAEEYEEALRLFLKAYKLKKERDILFNIACSALKLNNYKAAYKTLLIFFKKISPISYRNIWYVFCNLINQIQEYSGLLDIYDSLIMEKSGSESTILFSYELERDRDNDIILLCRTIVYFLHENNKNYLALKVVNYLETNAKDENESRVKNQIRALLESSIRTFLKGSPLTRLSINKVIDTKIKRDLRSKIDDITISKTSIELSFSKGFILNYFSNKGYGFICEEIDDNTYFFHISAVIDDELDRKLKKYMSNQKIDVYFEKSSSPKGLIAIKISLFRDIEESYKLAIKQANRGEYSLAISQIKNVLTLNPNYSDANELYLKWREYLRISSRLQSVPIGSNPYARAKRADVIEQDMNKTEQLLREAIRIRDNYESAIKDLANILTRLKRPTEAVELLEKYHNKVRNRLAIENILVNLYRKVQENDKAITLLESIIKQTNIKEKKAKLIYQIGYIYLNQEDYDNAQISFKEILNFYPYNISAKKGLAICLIKQKQFPKAKEVLLEIVEKYPDEKVYKLLSAVSKVKETVLTTYVNDMIAETSSLTFSIVQSKFSQFYLDNCDFEGVPTERLTIDDNYWKMYNGTKDDAILDLQNLEDIIRALGGDRPHEGANYYLSAARISLDSGGESDQFYEFLSKSFSLRGDATVQNKKSIDTARAWYIESLVSFDKIRDNQKIEEVVIHSLIKFLYSILGRSKIPIPPKTTSMEIIVKDIFKDKTKEEKVFNAIGYIILISQFAATRILPCIYNNINVRKLALKFLENMINNISSSKLSLEEFVNLWNEFNKVTLNKLNLEKRIMRTLTRVEITTAWLEDAIELIKPLTLKGRLFFRLDQNRVSFVQETFEETLELCKKNAFEDRERLSIKIDQSCLNLFNEIKNFPTKLSIEEILSVVEAIKEEIQQDLEELYETSMPFLTLRLPESLDSHTPDHNQEITVQIVVENKEGCSPAESLELKVEEEKKLFRIIIPLRKFDESLRGGDSRILTIPIKLSRKAIESSTFSFPVYAKYRSRLSQFKKTEVFNFIINLYPEDKFKRIENPYASYAEGGIVENRKMFFGRDELIENIKQSLIQDRTQNKSVMIFGQKRSGKSSILYHLKKRLEKVKNVLILDLKNIGVLLDENSSIPLLYQILWNILELLFKKINKWTQEGYSELEMQFPKDIDFYNHPTPVKYFINIFEMYMGQSFKKKDWKSVQIVLIIDEFSYIYSQIIKGKISEDFMKTWKAILQRNYFNVVLAGQDVMQKFKNRFANEFGTSQDERVTYLKKIDAKDLIDKPIRIPPFKNDGKTRYREKAIDRIIYLTAGSPFYIQIICNRLVEYMNQKHINYITEATVDHVKNELIRGANAFRIDKFDNLINTGDISEDSLSDKDVLEVLKSISKRSKTGPCTRTSITCETETPVDVILDDLVNRDIVERISGNLYNIKVGLFKEWLITNM